MSGLGVGIYNRTIRMSTGYCGFAMKDFRCSCLAMLRPDLGTINVYLSQTYKPGEVR
jgi:hypothetical protein